MSDSRAVCPFTFGNLEAGECHKQFCELWIDDGKDSACALKYQALLLAKERAWHDIAAKLMCEKGRSDGYVK